MRQFQVLLGILVQRLGLDGHLVRGLLRLFRLFLLGRGDIVAALGALQLVDSGFAGLALVCPGAWWR